MSINTILTITTFVVVMGMLAYGLWDLFHGCKFARYSASKRSVPSFNTNRSALMWLPMMVILCLTLIPAAWEIVTISHLFATVNAHLTAMLSLPIH